ncbi:MAG: hypothetical protein MJY60_01465 [Bacteroidales bacterium]|nr:hypothetical protein [Bacteroidales bacterium]
MTVKAFHPSLALTAAAVMMACAAACSPKQAPQNDSAKAQNTQNTLTAAEEPAVIRTDVQNKAYFKDIFIDAGIEINGFPTMPAVTMLGMSYEWMRISNDTLPSQDLQRSIVCGTADDTNGRLLYPDGEPRFRMIYVNGGLAESHGVALEMRGRDAIRTFLANGGSYTGSCAGAYVATNGSRFQGAGYLGIWPAAGQAATITKIYPNYIMPEDSPLLKYYDFGGDRKVDSVKHWNGPYFEQYQDVPGTEVLAYNDWPSYKFHNLPSIIAYKPSYVTGRVILLGGHPEQVVDGEQRDLMAAVLLYAKDGNGCAKVKGQLRNGELRRMTKATEDNDPAFTKIGDRQCHHFVIALPKKARNIKVRLEALENYNLSLRMAKETYAFAEDAQYKVENGKLVKEFNFPELEAGTWYIGVQCEDTVTATETEGCDTYENTGVLNGVPYTISASWDIAETGTALMRRSADVNETIKLIKAPVTRVTALDSSVTKVVFATGSASTEGVRIDAAGSEEPIYASLAADGVLTISTPAAAIKLNEGSSSLFDGMAALKSVENFGALDFSNVISLLGWFRNCHSLEMVDLSEAAIDGSRILGMNSLFRYMPNLKEINLGNKCFSDPLVKSPSTFFTGASDKDGERTCSVSGELTIRCIPATAEWLAGTGLKLLHDGNKTIEPVKIKFIDCLSGQEINPVWK